jgi:hypothetical protein
MQCYICGATPAHKHHLYTRGAWGKRALVPGNEIPLCVPHHTGSKGVHVLGRDTWAKMYGLEDLLEKAWWAVVNGHAS